MCSEKFHPDSPADRHSIGAGPVHEVSVDIIRDLPDVITHIICNSGCFNVRFKVSECASGHHRIGKNSKLFAVIFKCGKDVHMVPGYAVDDGNMWLVKVKFRPSVYG